MNYRCLTGSNEKTNALFLKLPAVLYKGEICPQDFSTEKMLLEGTHPLSGDFAVVPMIVVDDKDEPVARGLLTFYDDDENAYLGFFECIKDIKACKVLMENAEKAARDKGKKDIIGPVDSSIWIGYRFKVFSTCSKGMDIGTYKPSDIGTYKPSDIGAYKSPDIGTYKSSDIETYKPLDIDVYKSGNDALPEMKGIETSSFVNASLSKDISHSVPYTGEPWNKPYYIELWEQCGFSVWKRYYSFRLRKITEKEGKPHYVERVLQFRNKGYEFRNLDIKKFDRTIREIYDLLIEIYASFPGYKRISYEAFYALFHNLKLVLSDNDVILIYKDEKLVAFSISVPNFYGNLFGRMNLLKLLKILWIKKSPKEMVYLYMGVDPSHLGLGSVMAELIRRELYRNGRVPIKALILENKVTGAYYNDLLDEKMEYVLLRKNMDRIIDE